MSTFMMTENKYFNTTYLIVYLYYLSLIQTVGVKEVRLELFLLGFECQCNTLAELAHLISG